MSSVVARAAVLAAALCLAAPAAAQEKTGNKPGFTLLPGSVRITLMRPAIRVGAQSTGGMFEPNADWTAQARENIDAALRSCQAKLGNEVLSYQEGMSGEARLASQYVNLFGAVADSVIKYEFFKGNRLPTKVRKGAFDWSMGPTLQVFSRFKAPTTRSSSIRTMRTARPVVRCCRWLRFLEVSQLPRVNTLATPAWST